jgi:hypothetical protein
MNSTIIFVEKVGNGWWAVSGLAYPEDTEAQPEDAGISSEFPNRKDAMDFADAMSKEIEAQGNEAYIEAESDPDPDSKADSEGGI